MPDTTTTVSREQLLACLTGSGADAFANLAELIGADDEEIDAMRELIDSGQPIPTGDLPVLAVIAFQPEAWESAGTALHRLEGWTVDAVPVDGEPFTATVGDVIYPEGGGGPQVELRVWVDGDPGDEVRTLDIFDEIVRLEVC